MLGDALAHRVMFAVVLSFLLIVNCAMPANARILYVSPRGSDAQNGSNWSKAVRTPGRALALAAGQPNIDVWCAGAVYDIQRPLLLPQGVRLYGGFSGHERFFHQRQIEKFPTALKSAYGKGILILLGGGPETRVDGFVLQGVRGRECAIRLVGAAPTLTNNIFRWNQAIGYSGGAISCANRSNPLIASNRFESNISKLMGTQGGQGGAIFAAESSPIIERNVFSVNSAEGLGGALCLIGGSPVLRGNLFQANTANVGGAVFLSRASGEVAANRFLQNVATTIGGGAYLTAGTDEFQIHDNLFANNVAVGAAALALESCSGLFVNNTVAQNRSGSGVAKAGGAISAWGTANLSLINNIVAFNTAGLGLIGGNISSDYNCVFGNQAYNYAPSTARGNNDFSFDPDFVDRQRLDFHLKDSSPCRDRGDTHRRISHLDWEGDSRLFGKWIDIGADEVCARVVSVVFDRPSLCGGLTSQGTVTISMADPARGIAVRLTSSDLNHLKTPFTAIIPAGQTKGVFQAAAQEVATAQDVAVTGAFGNSTAAGTVRVLPWLADHIVEVSQVIATYSTRGVIYLNSPAPKDGMSVKIASSDPAASVPESIIVPEGEGSVAYPISTGSVTSETPVTIVGSHSGVSLTAKLIITPLIRQGTKINVDNFRGEIGSPVTSDGVEILRGNLQSEEGTRLTGVPVTINVEGDSKSYLVAVREGEFFLPYTFPGPAGSRRVLVEFAGNKSFLPSKGEATLTSLELTTYTDGTGEGVEGEPGTVVTLIMQLTDSQGVGFPGHPLDFYVFYQDGEA